MATKYVHPVECLEDLVEDHWEGDDYAGDALSGSTVKGHVFIVDNVGTANGAHRVPEMDGNGAEKQGCRCSCSYLISQICKPQGASGHSYFRKVRFAGSLFSPFHMFTVLGAAKEIYLEKFGADPTAMGIIVTVISMWGIFATFIHGILQDMRCLSKFFPLEKWGRRAPWMLTHCIIGSATCILVYLPDLVSRNPVFTHAWYACLFMLGLWGAGSCITAFETARQEIYPYKEERIIVEGFCKYSAMMGGASGGLPFLVLAAFSTLPFRILMSFCWILPCTLLSLESVPVLKEARSPGTAESLCAICKLICEAMPFRKESNTALQHLMAMSFWNGAYGTWIASVVFYYVTYVLRPQTAVDRTFIIGGAGLIAGATESILNIVYMWIFGAGDARQDKSGAADNQLLHFVVGSRLINCIVTFLLIGVAPPSVPLFFLWSFCVRVGVCGFTFWRISAKCWLVDEACYLRNDRREGTLFGAVALAQSVAGALFSSLAALNLPLFGFKTRNCEDHCDAFDGSLHTDCMENCFREIVAMQPDGFRTYIKLVIGVVAPVCELLVAFHAFCFPIKGVRLRRLYHTIMASHGDESYLESPTAAQGNIVSRTTANIAASKIALVVDNIDQTGQAEWQEHLSSVVKSFTDRPSKVRKRATSCAVIFETLEDMHPNKDESSPGRLSVISCYSGTPKHQKEDDLPRCFGSETSEHACSEKPDTNGCAKDPKFVELSFSEGPEEHVADLAITDFLQDIEDSPQGVEHALRREEVQRACPVVAAEAEPLATSSQCCWPLPCNAVIPCNAFRISRTPRGELSRDEEANM